MDHTLELIVSVPTAIWVAIISPIISAASVLLGVFLSNRGHLKRLEAQFVHDRTLNSEDRAYNMKKECLLNAIAAINIGVRQVAAIPNLNVPSAELLSEFTRRSDDVAKAIMISSEGTAISIQRAVRIVSNTFITNIVERTKLETKNRHYQELIQQKKCQDIYCQKILSDLQGLSSGEDNYEKKRGAMSANLEVAKRILDCQSQVNAALFQEIIQDTVRLAKQVTDGIFTSSEIIFEPTIRARNELNIGGEMSEFKEVVEQFKAEFEERHRIILSEIQSLAGDPPSQFISQKG